MTRKDSQVRFFRLAVILAIVVFTYGSSSAQFLGQMCPGSVPDVGHGKVGGYFIVAEDATATVGSMRFGVFDDMEARIRFGLIDEERDNIPTAFHAIVGADLKYLIWSQGQSAAPFDIAIGGAFEFAQLQTYEVVGVGFSTIGSLAHTFNDNYAIEPYISFNLRLEYEEYYDWHINNKNRTGYSESDFEAGFNVGALFSIAKMVDVTAEFQYGHHAAGMLGISFTAF